MRFKGAEHRDWMQSWQSFRMAMEAGDLSLPGLSDVISDIIGVWPHIVFYLKETERRTAAIVLWYGVLFYLYFTHKCQYLIAFSCLEKRD